VKDFTFIDFTADRWALLFLKSWFWSKFKLANEPTCGKTLPCRAARSASC
jgi:hypothetical protein